MNTTRWLSLSAFCSLLLLPLLATSARAEVELTPFAGYRVGGDFEDFDFRGVDLEDSESYGLIADFDVGGGFQFELLYSVQDTRLESLEPVFVIQVFPPPDVPDFQPVVLDLDVEYWHAGLLYEWGTGGDVRPFVVGSAGLTRLIPEQAGFSTEDRFSAAFGGGVKLMLGGHVGLRFEGRGFTTFVDDDGDALCDRRRCYHHDSAALWQIEGLAGLVLRF